MRLPQYRQRKLNDRSYDVMCDQVVGLNEPAYLLIATLIFE
jgi:hypothetical protein